MSQLTLWLTLQARWFDKMLADVKHLEYREVKGYWISRLVKRGGGSSDPTNYELHDFTETRIVNGGYFNTKKFRWIARPIIKIHVYRYRKAMTLHQLYPKNEEPLKDGKWYFVIEMGAITERGNC